MYNAEERIGFLRSKLDKAFISNDFSTAEKNAIKDDLNQAYLEDEIYWKQKSRIMWLRSGDRNTRYFHAVTKARWVRNTTGSIQDDHGVIRKGHKEVSDVATTYFQKLYAPDEVDLDLYTEVFMGFKQRVTQDMNDDLVRPTTEEEINTTKKKPILSVRKQLLYAFGSVIETAMSAPAILHAIVFFFFFFFFF